MNDVNGALNYNGKDYKLVFNLNVLEAIQDEYGTFNKWVELITDGDEPNAKAVSFAFTEMINEGLDIESEETGESYTPLTRRKVARMITEIGLAEATETLNNTIEASTKAGESSKNESSTKKNKTSR